MFFRFGPITGFQLEIPEKSEFFDDKFDFFLHPSHSSPFSALREKFSICGLFSTFPGIFSVLHDDIEYASFWVENRGIHLERSSGEGLQCPFCASSLDVSPSTRNIQRRNIRFPEVHIYLWSLSVLLLIDPSVTWLWHVHWVLWHVAYLARLLYLF